MNPEELDEQFQAMESDPHVKAAAADMPPPAARKKRVTVAELNKTIDELTELVDVNVFDWLEKLDTRVQHFENAEAEKIDTLPESVIRRFEKMEKGIAILQNDINNTLNTRLDALETAISATVHAFRQHLEEISGEQPAAAQEIEFAKPPEPSAPISIRAGDIAAVAAVCLTMNDVLLVARALRDSPNLELMDKNEILNIACQSAGIDNSHGLQIRAGIHDRRA